MSYWREYHDQFAVVDEFFGDEEELDQYPQHYLFHVLSVLKKAVDRDTACRRPLLTAGFAGPAINTEPTSAPVTDRDAMSNVKQQSLVAVVPSKTVLTPCFPLQC